MGANGQGLWWVQFNYEKFNYWRSGFEDTVQTFTVKAKSSTTSSEKSHTFQVTFIRDCNEDNVDYNQGDKHDLGLFEYIVTDPELVI